MLRAVFVLLLLLAVLYATREQWQNLSEVRRLSATDLFLLSALFIASQILAGLTLKAFALEFRLPLSPREWFGLVCIRSLGNYLPLNAGWTANALFLKLRKDFPISTFAVLMAGNLVLALLTAGVMGLALLTVVYFRSGDVELLLAGVYVGVVVVSLLFLALPIPNIVRLGRVGEILRTMRDGWNTLRTHRELMLKVVGLQVASQIVAALQYLIVCHALGAGLGIIPILILSISTTIIQFVTLVPGNLGIRETIGGVVAAAFGISFSTGFLAAAMTRVVNMTWVFLLGSYFAFTLPLTARQSE